MAAAKKKQRGKTAAKTVDFFGELKKSYPEVPVPSIEYPLPGSLGGSTDDVTRARASAATVAERIEHIVGMMKRLEWERGVSAIGLAQAWGLAQTTVEGMAAEASRIVRRDMTPKERGGVQASIGANLVHISHRMTDAVDQLCDAKEFGDAAKAAQAATQAGNVATMILGERAPEKQEISLTEDEARAKYKALTGKDWGPA